jgi:hypothetical protein
MAGLQINKVLNRVNGGTIPSGSVISWSSTFVAGTLIVRYQPMYNFLSVADRDAYFADPNNSMPPVMCKEIENMQFQYEKTMTQQEFDDLNTQTGVLDTVQDWLKDAIVAASNGYLTAGDIAIVS